MVIRCRSRHLLVKGLLKLLRVLLRFDDKFLRTEFFLELLLT